MSVLVEAARVEPRWHNQQPSSIGPRLFEFVCDHIVPGCTHTDKDESRDALMERVAVHLRERHNLDHRADPVAETLKTTGISFIRPV